MDYERKKNLHEPEQTDEAADSEVSTHEQESM
jgi:hypothetical protein